MEYSELNQLIKLLDNPSVLKQKIEILRKSSNLMEETEGFIKLYYSKEEDCAKIKEYLKETKTKIISPLKKKNQFTTYLKYAAFFALLFGVGSLLFNKKEKLESLTHQFEEHGLINYMSTSPNSKWEDIMFDFKTKNYVRADHKIEKALIITPKNDTLMYFFGVVKFKLNKLKEAKIQLKKLQDFKTSIYHEKSIYYLGLIEFKRGQLTTSKTIFKSLLNSTDMDVKNASFEHVNEIQSKLK